MMAEARDDDEIFVYMGGDQVVPRNVRRVRIDKSVTIIPERAFEFRRRLIYVEFHEGIETIEKRAFYFCYLLRSIKLLGVKIINMEAFCCCFGLTEVQFGDKLETIEGCAFQHSYSLRTITMPSARNVGEWAFANCKQLTALTFGEELERIGQRTFDSCVSLRRIAMSLDCIIGIHVFDDCPNLATVGIVGGIHRTVASLHLKSWKNEMMNEMNRINQVLPVTFREKTAAIQLWIQSVISQLDHYKAEHKALLKEATTLLELALWKANLDENEEGVIEKVGVRTTRGRRKRARKEICVTSGASIVIKNVLLFLELK